jgi:hypothetical protein
MTIDPDLCRKDPDLALAFLAEHLRNGTLGLAIGAGASKYLNLPLWYSLVNECSVGAGLAADMRETTPTETLCARMEVVEKYHSGGRIGKGEALPYREAVRAAMYKGVDFDRVLHSDLLISIGALVMGSRRGSVREILNFNFDDVLEWYLYLHGYDLNVVTTIPALRTGADVTIYHPHGYLPYHQDWFVSSSFLIFSQYSYDDKMGDIKEPWSELTRMFLKSKVALLVGLSGSDPTFGPIFRDVQKALGTSRATGLWLFGPDADLERMDRLQGRNLVPLEFSAFEEWPSFLLKVCQCAAGGV